MDNEANAPHGAKGQIRLEPEIPGEIYAPARELVERLSGYRVDGTTLRYGDGEPLPGQKYAPSTMETRARVALFVRLLVALKAWILAEVQKLLAPLENAARQAAREEIAIARGLSPFGEWPAPRRWAVVSSVRHALLTSELPKSAEPAIAARANFDLRRLGRARATDRELAGALGWMLMSGEIHCDRLPAREGMVLVYWLDVRQGAPFRGEEQDELGDQPEVTTEGPSSSRAPDPALCPPLSLPALAPVPEDAPEGVRALVAEMQGQGIEAGVLTLGAAS